MIEGTEVENEHESELIDKTQNLKKTNTQVIDVIQDHETILFSSSLSPPSHKTAMPLLSSITIKSPVASLYTSQELQCLSSLTTNHNADDQIHEIDNLFHPLNVEENAQKLELKTAPEKSLETNVEITAEEDHKVKVLDITAAKVHKVHDITDKEAIVHNNPEADITNTCVNPIATVEVDTGEDSLNDGPQIGLTGTRTFKVFTETTGAGLVKETETTDGVVVGASASLSSSSCSEASAGISLYSIPSSQSSEKCKDIKSRIQIHNNLAGRSTARDCTKFGGQLYTRSKLQAGLIEIKSEDDKKFKLPDRFGKFSKNNKKKLKVKDDAKVDTGELDIIFERMRKKNQEKMNNINTEIDVKVDEAAKKDISEYNDDKKNENIKKEVKKSQKGHEAKENEKSKGKIQLKMSNWIKSGENEKKIEDKNEKVKVTEGPKLEAENPNIDVQNLTPRSKFKKLRRKFENVSQENMSKTSKLALESLNNSVRKQCSLTPSSDKKEKLAAAVHTDRSFNAQGSCSKVKKSDGIQNGPNRKRKVHFENEKNMEILAIFSPHKKTKKI